MKIGTGVLTQSGGRFDRERFDSLCEELCRAAQSREVVVVSSGAVALGVEAVKAGRSVYFATLADLVGALAKAEREGMLRQKIRFFCRPSLLIVDEIGYLPVGSGGGNLFFQLVNACYERCAMVMTGNRGFGEWADVFGDAVVATAMLDNVFGPVAPETRKAIR